MLIIAHSLLCVNSIFAIFVSVYKSIGTNTVNYPPPQINGDLQRGFYYSSVAVSLIQPKTNSRNTALLNICWERSLLRIVTSMIGSRLLAQHLWKLLKRQLIVELANLQRRTFLSFVRLSALLQWSAILKSSRRMVIF